MFANNMNEIAVDPHRLEQLLTYCSGFAKEMLTRSGAFYPFGAAIKTDSEFTAIGGHTGEEHPPREEVYLLLESTLRQQFAEGSILAAALAVDVNIPRQFNPPFPDGIRILIECKGYARMFYIPYSLPKRNLLNRLTGQTTPTFGEFITVDVRPALNQDKETGEPTA